MNKVDQSDILTGSGGMQAVGLVLCPGVIASRSADGYWPKRPYYPGCHPHGDQIIPPGLQYPPCVITCLGYTV